MPFVIGGIALMLFGGGIGTGVAVSGDESPITAVKNTTKWLVIGVGLIVFGLWQGAIKWKS